MSKKMINSVHLEGILYEADLEVKVTGEKSKNPGTQFITGKISVATDDDCLNVVDVHFTYVTANTASGKPNATYNTLQNIQSGVYKTMMEVGKDAATRVRVDSAIGLNEFYTDRNGGEPELVSAKRNEGGFVHAISPAEITENRNRFDCDMLINKVRRMEADEEKNLPEKVIISGAVFDFRKNLMPVEFVVYDAAGMDYFESLETPVFTKVWGPQVSTTVVKTVTEESAFGAPTVRETKTTRKEFVVAHANPSPYEWDSEESITVAEINEAISNREINLADIKRRFMEYKTGGATKPAIANNSGFNF